jgi:hypothetical protein
MMLPNVFFRIEPGLPDFSFYNLPELEKIYHMAINYTQWPENIPKCGKIDQME